jgi:hypothetical protein
VALKIFHSAGVVTRDRTFVGLAPDHVTLSAATGSKPCCKSSASGELNY